MDYSNAFTKCRYLTNALSNMNFSLSSLAHVHFSRNWMYLIRHHQITSDDNRDFSIIEYPHLTQLYLTDVHDDYIDQFLVNIKTCLPNDILLRINDKCLQRVTNNFTSDATQVNCTKLGCRLICD